MNQTRKDQIEAARRRDMERERRLFIAASVGRDEYQRVCEQVESERAAERVK